MPALSDVRSLNVTWWKGKIFVVDDAVALAWASGYLFGNAEVGHSRQVVALPLELSPQYSFLLVLK